MDGLNKYSRMFTVKIALVTLLKIMGKCLNIFSNISNKYIFTVILGKNTIFLLFFSFPPNIP